MDVIIQALEKRGVARLLAEPNLVAMSGDTASFLAGGEFPFPVPGALNTTSVEFKKFGVGLAFTPTVLGDGLINLKIAPEVSQLDHCQFGDYRERSGAWPDRTAGGDHHRIA